MGLVDDAINVVATVAGAAPIVGPTAEGIIRAAGGTVAGTVGSVPIVGELLGSTGLIGGPEGGSVEGAFDPIGMATRALDIFGGQPGAPSMEGFTGGNGRFSKRTIVETIDLTTGKIVMRKTMPGAPHIMNSDITAARRVIRQSAKLARKIPRKTVRESKTKQLTDAAIDKALRDVNSGGGPCPS